LPLNAWALSDRIEDGSAAQSVPGIEIAEQKVAADRAMRRLAFIFTAAGIVSIGMATNLPRLFNAIGASPAAAIAAASLMGPAQVVARIIEYSARRRINPLLSAKIASALHPVAAIVIAIGGAPAAALFSVIHGAGNGLLTIARGTLPLALFGPSGYGARIGRISAPARVGQAN
jgi:hypothetical protein